MTERVILSLSLKEWIGVFQMHKSSSGFLGIWKILFSRELDILEWLKHTVLWCREKKVWLKRWRTYDKASWTPWYIVWIFSCRQQGVSEGFYIQYDSWEMNQIWCSSPKLGNTGREEQFGGRMVSSGFGKGD